MHTSSLFFDYDPCECAPIPTGPVAKVESPMQEPTRAVSSEGSLRNRPATPQPGLTSGGCRIQSGRSSAESMASGMREEVRQMNVSKTAPSLGEMQGSLGKLTADFPDGEDQAPPEEQPVSILKKKGKKRERVTGESEEEGRPSRASPMESRGSCPKNR